MSIRAYIITRTEQGYDEKYRYTLVAQEKEPLFNVWHHTEVFDLIRTYGFDGTNDDSVGEIEIDDEMWDEVKEEEDFSKFSDEEIKILQKIDSYFKEGNEYLTLLCY